MITVLQRLLKHIRKIGPKIRYALLDRAFFNVPEMQFLQVEKLPFLMPVMFRGRRSKKSRKATGLRHVTEVGGLVYLHNEEPQARGDVSYLRWVLPNCRLAMLVKIARFEPVSYECHRDNATGSYGNNVFGVACAPRGGGCSPTPNPFQHG